MLRVLLLYCLIFVPWTVLAAEWSFNRPSLLGSKSEDAGRVVKELRRASVIPDVLHDDFKPILSISLTYKKSRTVVDLGNEISPSNATHRPVLQITPFYRSGVTPSATHDADKTYTLVLSDPDATSRAEPVKSQMCHWILTAIPSKGAGVFTDLGHTNLQQPLSQKIEGAEAHELIPYLPPGPPPKTGYHRYIFVLLEHEHPGDDRNLSVPRRRPHFGFKKRGQGVMEWAEQNSLVPVAANFFYAANED